MRFPNRPSHGPLVFGNGAKMDVIRHQEKISIVSPESNRGTRLASNSFSGHAVACPLFSPHERKARHQAVTQTPQFFPA